MFKDTEKELKRLEEELLAEEELDEETEAVPDDAEQETYDDTEDWDEMFEQDQTEEPQEDMDMTRIFYGGEPDWQDRTRVFNVDALQAQQEAKEHCADHIYNADNTDEDLQDYASQVEEPARKSMTGLVVTAMLLTAGILGVVIWWLIRFGGALG